MQRIGGEEHTSEAEFRDEARHSGNLVRRRRDLLVRQDQRSVTGKRAQHVGGRLIMQVVEAAARRLAIERDGAPALRTGPPVQVTGVAAKGGFKIGGIESEEEIAQGVERRSAPEVSTEDGVQALAVDVDEGHNALVRGRPGEHRQH
jgi:hypothetical protein